MENIQNIQPYLFLLIGVILLIVVIFKKSTGGTLKTSGQKAEGIIFELEETSIHEPQVRVKDKITVRFVTKDQEWISGDIKQDFAIYFTKQYKVGDVVQVYYDPKDPSSFIVDTKQSKEKSRILFVIIGFVFLGIGLYQIFQ